MIELKWPTLHGNEIFPMLSSAGWKVTFFRFLSLMLKWKVGRKIHSPPSTFVDASFNNVQSWDIKFRLVFFVLKSSVGHTFSQLYVDQFGRNFVHYWFYPRLKVHQIVFQIRPQTAEKQCLTQLLRPKITNLNLRSWLWLCIPNTQCFQSLSWSFIFWRVKNQYKVQRSRSDRD